jgi:hypothetical protein
MHPLALIERAYEVRSMYVFLECGENLDFNEILQQCNATGLRKLDDIMTKGDDVCISKAQSLIFPPSLPNLGNSQPRTVKPRR